MTNSKHHNTKEAEHVRFTGGIFLRNRLDLSRKDKFGQVIKAGDVVAYNSKHEGIQLVVYKEDAGGSESKGSYGRFLSDTRLISIKYANVAFVFDSLYTRRASNKQVLEAIRNYYEGIRKV